MALHIVNDAPAHSGQVMSAVTPSGERAQASAVDCIMRRNNSFRHIAATR